MNTYKAEFFSDCPALPRHSARVKYTLEIITASHVVIMAEAINEKLNSDQFRSAYHEKMADELAATFPGAQTLTAHHHGVDITTTREGAAWTQK